MANGVALRVEGSWDAARSRLVASKASVRARDVTAGEVSLIGLVSDYVNATDFSVRGMPVTTNAGTVVGAGCSIAAVVDGTAVRTWFYRTGITQPWIALQINKVSWN